MTNLRKSLPQPRLPRPGRAHRAAALVVAVLACALSLGAQLALVAHYTGEADVRGAQVARPPAASVGVAAASASARAPAARPG